MIYFSTKQPYEAFAISFDFTSLMGTEVITEQAITATDITTSLDATDTVLDNTKSGINLDIIYGWVMSGQDGHNYLISCKIIGDAGSQYQLDGILPVKTSSTDLPIDPDLFRASFPEFASKTKYSNDLIMYWADIGTKLLNEARWGDLLEQGLNLWTAHHVVLASANVATETVGGNTGFGFRD